MGSFWSEVHSVPGIRGRLCSRLWERAGVDRGEWLWSAQRARQSSWVCDFKSVSPELPEDLCAGQPVFPSMRGCPKGAGVICLGVVGAAPEVGASKGTWDLPGRTLVTVRACGTPSRALR